MVAQDQGRIVYEEKIDIHRRIPEERAEMKDMIPQFRTSKFELFYTQDFSKYKAQPRDQEEEMVGSHGSGGGFRMRMNAPRREVYKSLSEDKAVDEREFMSKMFLIKGKSSPFAWKIADGQKKVMDFACMQALYQDSTGNYVVWFTPQIPISNGPAEFGGLPGMIMQVDINDGERTITAVEVHAEVVDPELLKEPTKGKEVTQEEFREIMHEKMKEMREMNGGGPTMMMIHRD
jgi:GLPGLI family protein